MIHDRLLSVTLMSYRRIGMQSLYYNPLEQDSSPLQMGLA